jgi:hypothetical protein
MIESFYAIRDAVPINPKRERPHPPNEHKKPPSRPGRAGTKHEKRPSTGWGV